MATFLVGKGTRVTLTRQNGKRVELGVPIKREGDQLKTGSVYVTDNGRPVVFVEYIADKDGDPLVQGEVVSLTIDHGGEPGLMPVHIERGILDIIGVESYPKSAVKQFLVVAALSD